ncbi:MAG: FlgD immunoglobulin-like domain containing protein [bacterium]
MFACFCSLSAAVTYSSASPDRASFKTTSITCSIAALSVPAGGDFYFFHSDTLLFTSSSAVKLTSGTDYFRSGTTADISYTYADFTEGNNNWYKWGYINGPANDESDPYNVIVAANEAPEITVIQPDHNGFGGTNVYVEILLTDEGLGIDESSISFSLADAAGSTIFSFSGNSQNLFNLSTGKLSYFCPQALSAGTNYTLTVSAADAGYRAPYAHTTTKTVTFNVRNDAIADLIPVPSPFNPNIETCAIHYVLNTAAQDIEINVYDMSGSLVQNLVRGASRSAGENTVDMWDGRDYSGSSLANGVYVIEVAAGSDKRYSSVILMRK